MVPSVSPTKLRCMRLFLGLEIPQNVKDYIYNYLLPIQLSPKGWENPHDYHQTMLFIGESTDDDVDEITQRLKAFRFAEFNLTLSHITFFNRRIMYIAASDAPELNELKKQVDLSFPQWVNKSEKQFLPHVTVKRWQRYEYEHLKAGLARQEFIPQTFLVNKLCLFKSQKDELNRKFHIMDCQDFFTKKN